MHLDINLNFPKMEFSSIVFCSSLPDFSSIDEGSTQLYVLFDSELNLSGEFSGKNILFAGSLLTSNDYETVRIQAEHEWREFCSASNDLNLNLYHYVFFNLRLPALFWGLLCDRVVEYFRPNEVWVQKKIEETTTYSDDLCGEEWTSFIRKILPIVIFQSLECLEVSIRFYCCSDDNADIRLGNRCSLSKAERLRQYAETRISRLIRICDVAFRPRILRAKSIYLQFLDSKEPSILLITQDLKSARLESHLLSRKIRYHHISYHKLHHILKRTGKAKKRFSAKFSFSVNPADLTQQWIRFSCKSHTACISSNIDKVFSKYSVIITDNEVDPLIRQVNRWVSKTSGKKIITIPEGGTSNYCYKGYDCFFLEDHSSIYRGLNSALDLTLAKDRLSPDSTAFICGYSTFLTHALTLGRMYRLCLKWLLPKNRGLIFYDPPFLRDKDIGICRGYRRDEARMMDEIAELSSVAYKSGFGLVVSSRGSINKIISSLRYPYALTWMQWSIAASAADVIVSSQSSILAEGLSKGKVVVLWNPSEEIYNIYSYLNPRVIDNLIIVNSASELKEKLELAMRLAKARKIETAMDPYYLSPPNYRTLENFLKVNN